MPDRWKPGSYAHAPPVPTCRCGSCRTSSIAGVPNSWSSKKVSHAHGREPICGAGRRSPAASAFLLRRTAAAPISAAGPPPIPPSSAAVLTSAFARGQWRQRPMQRQKPCQRGGCRDERDQAGNQDGACAAAAIEQAQCNARRNPEQAAGSRSAIADHPDRRLSGLWFAPRSCVLATARATRDCCAFLYAPRIAFAPSIACR